MKNFILPVFAVIWGLSSCAVHKTKSEPLNIAGRWEETWVAENSGVDYHDIYVIEQLSSGIDMRCEQRPNYTFTQIVLNGHQFSFRTTNPQDRDDVYIMDYSLIISDDLTRMKGKVETNHGANAEILLRKL